ncbi:MAG TPA: trypsin-like peptidase domain-containing protein [Rhodopila sp.]
MKRCRAPFWGLNAVLATIVVLWTSGLPARADDIAGGKPDTIQAVLPTVVNVTVRKDEAATAPDPVEAGANVSTPATNIKTYVGSGFVIDPSGLIVTNYHVVENAFEINVTFTDGTRLPGKISSGSRLADLALLKVDADHTLMAAQWGDSDLLQVGDQVFVAGNPFGIGLSLSAGIVSALNRNIQNSPYDDLIQTDATINHGNSGGPLFDMQGKVVGVNSAIISPTAGSAGIGFAEPASSARFVIDQLRKYGWVRPSWIGVKLQQVSPEIGEALGMARPEGAIVSWVLPTGPAKQAGLTIGDVITRFNGRPPSDDRALLRNIASTPVGNMITLTVRHEGEIHDLSFATMQWPRDQWDARDAPVAPQRPKIVIPPDLGLSLTPVEADQKRGLGLEDGLNGVLVKEVTPGSDPANRGMTGGDIILRVQDQPVATPAAVQAGIDAARAAKREYVAMLILPKVREVPGPKWVALQLE